MHMNLTFVLGGIASGKSAYAETLCHNAHPPRIYLATAQSLDSEMAAKIAKHQTDRGNNWQTIETTTNTAQILRDIPPHHIVLFDCATMWLSNQMMADADIDAAQSDLIDALQSCASPVIIVSNEVGLSGISENALARRFTTLQGRLNQSLAAICDRVVLVTAGLPQTLKGPIE